jgi:hypothetical protein
MKNPRPDNPYMRERTCPQCGESYWEHAHSAAETIEHLETVHPGWREESMTETLHLSDDEMEEHYIEDIDLVWGVKSWRLENGLPMYAWEMRYRIPGDERVAYLREQVVGDPEGARTADEMTTVPTMVKRFARFLHDADYRAEIHALSMVQQEVGQ